MTPSVPFTDRIADGWRRSGDALWLAFVPVVLSLFSVDKILGVLGLDGFHVGVTLVSFPSPSSGVWQFVNTPQSDAHVGLAASLGVVAAAFVTSAFLLGGYLGSLRRFLDAGAAEYDFVGDARAHLAPMAVWTGVPSLVTAGVVLVTGGFGTVDGSSAFLPVVLVLFVLYAVFGYLFYAAPFLVVLRETGIADALRSSYDLALSGGPYASYAVGYLLFALLVSVPMSLFVVNLGVVGLLLGIPVGGRVGLAATTASMRFVADVDDRSPTLRRWDDHRGVDTPGDAGGDSRGERDEFGHDTPNDDAPDDDVPDDDVPDDGVGDPPR